MCPALPYNMNPPPVFIGHVHYCGEVSTCESSKLKTFNDQGKKSSDMVIAQDSKYAVFLHLFNTEYPTTGK